MSFGHIGYNQLALILHHPSGCTVRRKPRMIGSRVVQAGIAAAPDPHRRVWLTDICNDPPCREISWEGSERQIKMLKCGLIHLSEQPARAMGEALAIVAKGEE